jgi:hypothetical protein
MKSATGGWVIPEGELIGLTPEKARDLIVNCLLETQREVFMRQRENLGLACDERSIMHSVNGAVRLAFAKTGGDFNNPTKDSLMAAVESLSRTVATWGTPPEVVEQNSSQVMIMMRRLA